MTTVTDDFAGTGALSANWTFSGGTAYARNAGLLQNVDGTAGQMAWNANTFSGDQEVSLTITTIIADGGSALAPMLKYDSLGSHAYTLVLRTNLLVISKDHSVISSGTGVVSSGDVIRFTAQTSGSDLILNVYQNGSLIDTVTDSSPLTGNQIGISGWDTSTGLGYRYDDFSGGDYVAGGGSTGIVSILAQHY